MAADVCNISATESYVREKASIFGDNFEDVKVISLPGNFQEKIVRIGNSLSRFSRLQNLDLSRNAISSIEGLELLLHLQRLNLYYNNISTLDELDQLKHNSKLTHLDLRLNPVTRTEPDYRLYLIHLLPSLRVLDDRSIRDEERRAAIMHFGAMPPSGNTHQKRQYLGPSTTDHEQKESAIDKRINHVRKLGRVPDIEAMETEDIIDTQIRKKFDNEPVRPQAGSANYTVKEVHKLEQSIRRDLGKSSFFEATKSPDESCFLSNVTFTPNPKLKNTRVSKPVVTVSFKDDSKIVGQTDRKADNFNKTNLIEDKRLVSLCELVDRYWNGSGSLQTNARFKAKAHQILQDGLGMSSKNLSSCVSAEANDTLSLRHAVTEAESEVNKLKQQLLQLTEENEQLCNSLQMLELENSTLKMQQKSSSLMDNRKTSPVYNGQLPTLPDEISDLRRDNEKLRSQLSAQRAQLTQLNQLEELTTMLQQSHRSLLETHEQLLRQINDSSGSVTNTSVDRESRYRKPWNRVVQRLKLG